MKTNIHGNKVKITLKFKGREAAYAGMAEKVLHKFAEALEDDAIVDKAPKLEGRSMIMIVVPK
jgi:translation initiation factor IF-3